MSQFGARCPIHTVPWGPRKMEAAPSGTCGLLIPPAKDESSGGSPAGLTCFSLEVAHITPTHYPLARTNSGCLTARRLGCEGSNGVSGEHHRGPQTDDPHPHPQLLLKARQGWGAQELSLLTCPLLSHPQPRPQATPQLPQIAKTPGRSLSLLFFP